jgi:uncharacterized protein
MIEKMESAGIERGFLVAARTGRLGLPGSYHMPYEIVADARARSTRAGSTASRASTRRRA